MEMVWKIKEKEKWQLNVVLRGRVEVLGLNEICMSGQGASECRKGNQNGMWEGMIDGTVWTRLDKSYKGKSKAVVTKYGPLMGNLS